MLKLKPNPALQPFVKDYWLLDLENGRGNGIALTKSPIPENCLYFYPKNLPQRIDASGKQLKVYNNAIFGQAISSGIKMIIPNNYCMLKVEFHPTGFFKLFGTPMTLFADRSEEATSVFGKPFCELNERIFNARNFEEMASILNQYLLKQLSKINVKYLPFDTQLQAKNIHHFSVDQLASNSCLSTRQFERKFLDSVGVSPKIYLRVVRFNHALILKKNFPSKKWIDITYEMGYFDQMHFLKDFKQFTGIPPSTFDFENSIIY
jgi:AraC-like DNA-binding protein